ncbi:MAG TPA: hypothetical protein VLR94_01985 [Acidobacteriota bacterium]|nr:hypothetical protein [Acidobacteriota bacterium]
MKKWLWILLLLLPSCLFAEPYLALREGLKCSSCHVNRTGGGKRTRMGTGFGTQALPWDKIDLNEKKIPHFWSVLDDNLSIGGDFRFLNDSVFEEHNTTNTFQTDKANVYLSVKVLPDMLSFYLDEGLAPGGAQTREIFAMFEAMPAHGWIKAGKFLPPYGLRLEDDGDYIRQVTGFNFSNPDLGVEIGVEPGNWTFAASATNGTSGTTDNNTAKQAVASTVYVRDAFRVGASGSWNSGEAGDKNSGAAFAGLHLGRAVLLGEVDAIRDAPKQGRTSNQIVTYSEISYLVHDGMTLKAGYEYFDPDTGIKENERDRVLVGAEFFPVPFLNLSVYYRFNQSIPQNKPQNADELTFRLHLYF